MPANASTSLPPNSPWGYIDVPLVLDFLNDLETIRDNGPSSRNIRPAAIKSFMHFLEYRVPSAIEQMRRALSIPVKKAESKLVSHLTGGDASPPGRARPNQVERHP